MRCSRRRFLHVLGNAAVLAGVPTASFRAESAAVTDEQLARAATAPVLRQDLVKEPVKVATIELLRNGKHFLVRARSSDGAEGIAVANGARLIDTYPIFLNRVAPYFIGKDARNLDDLIAGVFVHQSNYKLQGLAFWVCVAAVEFALLDLLGQVTRKPLGALLGGVVRRDVAVYRASGRRGNKPEEEIVYLQKLAAETGARALKFKVGGRMSNNKDSLPGRTEALIPLVRKTFGERMTLYADSNGSYDVRKGIEVGRLLEEHGYAFFEEPCPFDHLEETKQVADALKIPVAGGEQESSLRRFRWMIHQGAVQVVQPDLHYFGGYIRCIRVARMAQVAGLPCTLHLSGSGLGFLDMLHFASCVPNIGPHQEYKGNNAIPLNCPTSPLTCNKGILRVPSGPGFGVEIDPGFIRKARRVTP
jgi:L-alanine-DL-glutamate epimerase-like enolase superfamily enzyme